MVNSIGYAFVIMMFIGFVRLNAGWVIAKPRVTLHSARIEDLGKEIIGWIPDLRLLLGHPVFLDEPETDEISLIPENKRLIGTMKGDSYGMHCQILHGLVDADEVIEVGNDKFDFGPKPNLMVCVPEAPIFKQDETLALTLYEGTEVHGEKVNDKWWKVTLVTGLEGLVSASDVKEFKPN